METPNLCTQVHTCRCCKKVCLCNTYSWACPWINDDEDQLCDPCMDKFAEEYIKWYEKEVEDGGDN